MSTPDNTFQELHAAHYDLIYADKPYAEEADFVAGLLGTRVGKLLDLACGTGRHAVEFARMGFEVTGVDYNEMLLEHAKANAEKAGVELAVRAGDMRKLDLGERFDCVTCLFDSIGYPATNDGIVAALTRAREHLGPGGSLAVEFLHAPAMVLGADPVRVRRWPTEGGGELHRTSETELDIAAGVMEVAYELTELKPDGTYLRGSETQRNRYFGAEEMRALMSLAGLSVKKLVVAYAPEDSEIDEDAWHILALAEAAKG
jgi:SAM-dependent methyltransferase